MQIRWSPLPSLAEWTQRYDVSLFEDDGKTPVTGIDIVTSKDVWDRVSEAMARSECRVTKVEVDGREVPRAPHSFNVGSGNPDVPVSFLVTVWFETD